MSEHYPEIKALAVPTTIGVRFLHQHNTAVFIHLPPYSGFDHAFEQTSDSEGIYFFRSLLEKPDHLFKALGGIGCNVISSEEPTKGDRQAYNKVFRSDQARLIIPDHLPDGFK